jgi:hypothetical protein
MQETARRWWLNGKHDPWSELSREHDIFEGSSPIFLVSKGLRLAGDGDACGAGLGVIDIEEQRQQQIPLGDDNRKSEPQTADPLRG